MKKRNLLITLLLSVSVLFGIGCSGSKVEGTFQDVGQAPAFDLNEIMASAPLTKEMLSGLDVETFNQKADVLVSTNPELVIQLTDIMAGMMYDREADRSGLTESGDPILPYMTGQLRDIVADFHDVYGGREDEVNKSLGIINQILELDPKVMNQSTAAVLDILKYMRDEQNAFSTGQDLAKLDGDQLISSVETITSFYEKIYGSGVVSDVSSGAFDVTAIIRSFLAALDEKDDAELEGYMGDMQKMFGPKGSNSGKTIADYEEKLVKWFGADTTEGDLVDYIIGGEVDGKQVAGLYSFMKEQKQVTVIAAKDVNFLDIDYDGRNDLGKKVDWIDYTNFLMDQSAGFLSASYQDGGQERLFAAQLIKDFQKDKEAWYKLEGIEIFDFDQPLMSWLKTTMTDYFSETFGDGSSNATGVSKEYLANLLWNGSSYRAFDGTNANFKGLMFNSRPGYASYKKEGAALNIADDGYVTRMMRTYSSDQTEKPFRVHAWNALDQQEGSQTNFKQVAKSYDDESLMESFIMNMQLNWYDEYFKMESKEWRWTSDGIGKPGLLDLAGGLITNTRNAIILNRYGYDPSDPEALEQAKNAGAVPSSLRATDDSWTMPMLADITYLMGAAGGYAAPGQAKAELSMKNCLEANQSTINSDGNIVINKMGASITVEVMGSAGIKRKSAKGGEGWIDFTTQHGMPAMEVMQPGTFRERTGKTTADMHTVYGAWAPQQGDMIGISGPNGRIDTGNWSLSEIGSACWEGYGPYTYKGKAPNGSKCKYEDEWYSDYYKISNTKCLSEPTSIGVSSQNLGANGARYKNYERIYKPNVGETGFEATADSQTSKYGYLRPTGSQYTDNYFTGSNWTKVTLDCSTREEAIRQNFQWLLREKRYQMVIPIHAAQELYAKILLSNVHAGRLEMAVYATVNCNGLYGVAQAKPAGVGLQDGNGTWGSGLRNNKKKTIARVEDNYVVDLTREKNEDAFRFTSTSFEPEDYNMSLDYTFELEAIVNFDWVNDLLKSIADIPTTIWGSFGPKPVLPGQVGENFQSLLTMATALYTQQDLMSDVNQAEAHNLAKFEKFLTTYYKGLLALDTDYSSQPYQFEGDSLKVTRNGEVNIIKAQDFPPIPKVKGVSYPASYNEDGSVQTWTVYTGDSQGKFDELVAITGMLAGTFHEDGTVIKNDGQPATLADKEAGNFKYYAKDGYRTMFGSLVDMLAALNGQIKGSGNTPAYNSEYIINRLVDYDPATNTVVPGSRKGLLPRALHSEFTNLADLEPVKLGAEAAARSAIQNYLASFDLTKGYAVGEEMEPYYYLNQKDGKLYLEKTFETEAPTTAAEYFNKPINRVRYLTDDRMLDEVSRLLNYAKEITADPNSADGIDHQIITTIQDAIAAANLAAKMKDESATAIEVPSEEKILNILKFVQAIEIDEVIQLVQDYDLLDLAKYWNFKFENFLPKGEEGNEDEMMARMWAVIDMVNIAALENVQFTGEKDGLQDKDGNDTFFKYSFGFKDALLDGVYKVADGQSIEARLDGQLVHTFHAGDLIVGQGIYLVTKNEKAQPTIKYISLKDKIGNFEFRKNEATGNQALTVGAKAEVIWPGFAFYVDFKTDTEAKNIDTLDDYWAQDANHDGEMSFDELTSFCKTWMARKDYDYHDPYYHAGELAPILTYFSNWDMMFSNVMDTANLVFFNLNEKAFQYGDSKYFRDYEFNSKNYSGYGFLPMVDDPDGTASVDKVSLIEWIFALAKNSSADNFANETDPLHFVKAYAFHNFYEAPVKAEYVNKIPAMVMDYLKNEKGYSDGDSLTVRNIIRFAGDMIDDKALNYQYTDKDGVKRNEVFNVDIKGELASGKTGEHVHLAAIGLDLMSTMFNPYSEQYKTAELFGAYKNFMHNFNVSVDDMQSLKGILYDLTTNPDGTPNHFFTNATKELPTMMDGFTGSWSELIDLGVAAFASDGVGTYVAQNMNFPEEASIWDVVDEMDKILAQPAFTEYKAEWSFWYQAGKLTDDLVDMMEYQLVENPSKGTDIYSFYGRGNSREIHVGDYFTRNLKAMFE